MFKRVWPCSENPFGPRSLEIHVQENASIYLENL